MTDDARPGSYASLDRRVTALEARMGGLETQVALATERLDVVKSMGSATHDAVKHLESILQQAFHDPYSVMPKSAAEEREDWRAWRKAVDQALDADASSRDELRGAKKVALIVVAVLGGLSSVVTVALAVYRAAHGA